MCTKSIFEIKGLFHDISATTRPEQKLKSPHYKKEGHLVVAFKSVGQDLEETGVKRSIWPRGHSERLYGLWLIMTAIKLLPVARWSYPKHQLTR